MGSAVVAAQVAEPEVLPGLHVARVSPWLGGKEHTGPGLCPKASLLEGTTNGNIVVHRVHIRFLLREARHVHQEDAMLWAK